MFLKPVIVFKCPLFNFYLFCNCGILNSKNYLVVYAFYALSIPLSPIFAIKDNWIKSDSVSILFQAIILGNTNMKLNLKEDFNI